MALGDSTKASNKDTPTQKWVGVIFMSFGISFGQLIIDSHKVQYLSQL